MIKPERKFCLACGAFVAGRIDKKFCDDACRTSWHNRSRQENKVILKKTDSILRLNRKILFDMVEPEGEIRLEKQVLMASGFRPDYLTRITTDSRGSTVRFYYEFGLRKLSDTEVEVFRVLG